MSRTSHFDSSPMKPTTESGKHAGNARIPVSAILAAIVMHIVPVGHTRLCAKPAALYVCLYVVIRPPELLISPVWIKGKDRRRGVRRTSVGGVSARGSL